MSTTLGIAGAVLGSVFFGMYYLIRLWSVLLPLQSPIRPHLPAHPFRRTSLLALTAGSNYIPVKQHRSFDGLLFNWFACSGIFFFGLIYAIITNSWFSYEAWGFTVFREGLIGGAVWTLSNLLTTYAISYVGLGIGYSLVNAAGILMGSLTGRFGLFGVKPQQPRSDTMWAVGLVFLLLAAASFSFLRASDTRDHPDLAAARGRHRRHRRGKVKRGGEEKHDGEERGESRGEGEGESESGRESAIGEEGEGEDGGKEDHHDTTASSTKNIPSARRPLLSAEDGVNGGGACSTTATRTYSTFDTSPEDDGVHDDGVHDKDDVMQIRRSRSNSEPMASP